MPNGDSAQLLADGHLVKNFADGSKEIQSSDGTIKFFSAISIEGR